MVHEILYLEKKEGSVMVRLDHGPSDPINPTQPVRKKPDPTRPEKVTGRVWAETFDPELKKPDPTRKLHIKLRANPT